MMDDLISKTEAITLPVMPKEHREYQTQNLDDAYEQGWFDLQKCIENLPSAQPEQRWIPVKWKPLDDKTRKEWEDALGYLLTDEEVKFGEADFKLPDDGDDIWVCTKSGIVDEDIFYNDNGMITLEYADITDIVAWMPRKEPEPYKGENAND